MTYREQIHELIDSRMTILKNVAEIKHICMVFWYSPIFTLEHKVAYFEDIDDYYSYASTELKSLRENNINTFCVVLDGKTDYVTEEFVKLINDNE